MKIFDKRPLSMILCVMLGGFVIFCFGNQAVRIALISLSVLILSALLLLKRKRKSTKILVCALSLSLLLSSLLSYLYFDCYFHNNERITNEESEIVGVITEEREYDGFYSFTFKCKELSGEEVADFKTTFIYDFRESEKNFDVGDTVLLRGILIDFEESEDFDAATYNYMRGVSLEITEISKITLIRRGEEPITNKISRYRTMLTERLILASGEYFGGFAAALLLGDKTHLDSQISLDFMRVGLSHTLALSGMHLAILTGVFSLLLSKIGISKKKRKIFEAIFIIGYVSLTGFPISVLRAGLMLLISSFLFMISHTSDSVTNLFISVAVICICTPYAIYDVSLWLSAFATLGLLVYAESRRETKEKHENIKFSRLKRAIHVSFMATVYSVSTVMILSSSLFGTYSVATLLTAPIFSPLIELYMHLSCIALIFGEFFSFGSLLIPIGKIILAPIGAFSSINGILTSTDFIAVRIIILLLTAFIVVTFTVKIKNMRYVSIALVSFLTLISVLCYASTENARSVGISEYTCDDGERIAFCDKDYSFVVDTSTPSKRKAYSATNYLTKNKIYYIDTYIFTSYSEEITDATDALAKKLSIDVIYLPKPSSSEEQIIADYLLDSTIERRTEFKFYSVGESIALGASTFKPTFRLDFMRGKLAFTLEVNERKYAYLSSGMLVGNSKAAALESMNGSYALILGRHGNGYNNYEFLYKLKGLKYLVISSRGVSMYKETESFYKDTEMYFRPQSVSFIR